MRFVFLAVFALLTVNAEAASPGDRAANYETCMASDSTWHNRWGKYVISFDAEEAFRICRSDVWGSKEVRSVSCHYNGEWLEAGYYCDEITSPASM
jgi:hypothetical protein